ncbi:hypothetical protein IAQ67_28770 (plasmid) [Paenibacillus peoriae]|uniref:Uncharacterized protein n=1 Tax=Paenibacillus peoriae TaxID=59893 RepID=A0A7H0YGZ3_9BACL|nr:hypothetical protein [Paenibacillus peoriae]QNR70351.1 hypothetical protein IAQ67_28770 [Paenibacillus peoriae]
MNKPEKAKEVLRNHLILAGVLSFSESFGGADGKDFLEPEFFKKAFNAVDDVVAFGAGASTTEELRALFQEEAENALTNLLELAKEFEDDAV